MSDKEDNKAKIIGTALKEWIEKSPYTKRDVARMLGVSPQYINGLCQGKPIGKVMANKISNLFGLSEYFLLTGEGFIEQPKEQNEKPNSFSQAASEFKKFEEKISQMQKTMDDLREAVKSQGIALRVQQQLIDRYRAELNNATPYTGMIASDDTIANLMDEKNPKDK